MQNACDSVIEEQPNALHQATRFNGRVIARSTAMREILARVRQVAGTRIPVLIQGEIGVGKAAIAREIHRQSPLGARPFRRVACGSLPASERQERSFADSGDDLGQTAGHDSPHARRGSLTPPKRVTEGLPDSGISFHAACPGGAAGLAGASQHGTLFLDGVEQLPFSAQVELLRDLQQGNGQSCDQDAPVPMRGRVIASSTCDLETAMVENRFDARLYYHLSFVRIEVPPLRHRQEDLRALVDHFLVNADFVLGSARHKLPRCFSNEAWQSLLQYEWPGNVLQLAAVVTHAAMLAEGPEIGQACVAELLEKVHHQAPDSETISVPLAGGLKTMELVLIKEVIRRCRGNKAAAARALKLHRRALYRLLEK